MAIREATADDLATVAALIRALADYERAADEVTFDDDELGHHLFEPDPAAHVLLAVDDDTGRAVGFALWFRSFSTWLGKPGIWLEDLFVLPEHRGRGHGLALLHRLRALTDGRIEWNVLDWNEPSIRFYESIGAVPVEGWTRYRWLTDSLSP